MAAPSEIPVYRAEIWERIAAGGGSPAQSEEAGEMSAGPRLAAEGEYTDLGRHSVSLAELLARYVARRVGTRVRSVAVAVRGEKLVVRGSAPSYYVRQLLQSAVQEFVECMGITSLDDIEFEIDVPCLDGHGARRPDAEPTE